MSKKVLVVCTTDSMIWNFLVPHIKNLERKGFVVECACSETGRFSNDLKKDFGFIVHIVPFCRSPYSLKNINAFKQLYGLVKRNRYDIIFCHEPVGGVAGRIIGMLCHCHVIYMAHGFHFYKGARLSSIVYYCVERCLAHFTDALIVINNEDYLVAQSFRAKRVFKVNGIGVDITEFISHPQPDYLRKEFSLTENDKVLLSVGELIPRKNHITVIKAVREMKNEHVHYFIAGDGRLIDKLNDYVQRAGIGKQIHFLGYRTDINSLCNAADIFVLPSLQEGLSVALMEAMACGKPVVASKIRGNVDLIDSDGGYLVEPNDVKGFSNAIEKMIEDAEAIKSFGVHNKEKVKEFDLKIVEKQIENIFNSYK